MTSNNKQQIKLRRFVLERKIDESGVSGTGIVAEGVKLTSGECVLSWLTDTRSIGIYHSSVEMMFIHGHGNCTILRWIDAQDDVIEDL